MEKIYQNNQISIINSISYFRSEFIAEQNEVKKKPLNIVYIRLCI